MFDRHRLLVFALVAALVGGCSPSADQAQLAQAMERIAKLEARVNEMPERFPSGGFIVRDDTGRSAVLTATGLLIEDGESSTLYAAGSVLLKDNESETEAWLHVGGLRLAINGKPRLIAGEAYHVERLTGEATTTPATLALYDADGRVRWTAPR